MKVPLNIHGVDIDRTIAPLLARELGIIISLFEDSRGGNADPIEKILVALHRLKGSSGFIGLKEIESRAREIENKIRETSSCHVEGVDSFIVDLKNLLGEIDNAIH